eukprot:3388765-Rhodomonas_salina.1
MLRYHTAALVAEAGTRVPRQETDVEKYQIEMSVQFSMQCNNASVSDTVFRPVLQNVELGSLEYSQSTVL